MQVPISERRDKDGTGNKVVSVGVVGKGVLSLDTKGHNVVEEIR